MAVWIFRHHWTEESYASLHIAPWQIPLKSKESNDRGYLVRQYGPDELPVMYGNVPLYTEFMIEGNFQMSIQYDSTDQNLDHLLQLEIMRIPVCQRC